MHEGGSSPRRLWHPADLAGAVGTVVVLGLLVWRLPIGVNFIDESYYALFVDDWLKGDIQSSSFTVLHQTSALLVYPLARIFKALTGSTDGLFLWLRYVFLAAQLASTAIWVYAWRRVGSRSASWLSGLLLLSFVPFGLPAPSYNTMGIQALTVAVACFVAARSTVGRVRWLWWGGLAVSTAVMTIAYPPLVVVALVAAPAALWGAPRTGRREPLLVVLTVGAVGLASWLLVASVLGFDRLQDSFTYLAAASDTGGIVQKVRQVGGTLRAHPVYAAALALTLVVGALRHPPRGLRPVLICASLLAVLVLPATLRPKSHDVITLLALSSLGTLRGLRSTEPREQLMAQVYGLALLAGVLTSYFATFPTSNFALGAAPAAAMAATSLWRQISGRWEQVVGGSAAGLVLLMSLTTFYGEDARDRGDRVQVHEGVFAGVRASTVDALTLAIVRRELVPLLGDARECIYVGPEPGIMLQSSVRLRMLSTYNVYPYPAATRRTLDAFYDVPANRPPLVVVHTVAGEVSPNPLGDRFAKWYAGGPTIVLPEGEIQVYYLRSDREPVAPT